MNLSQTDNTEITTQRHTNTNKAGNVFTLNRLTSKFQAVWLAGSTDELFVCLLACFMSLFFNKNTHTLFFHTKNYLLRVLLFDFLRSCAIDVKAFSMPLSITSIAFLSPFL